MTTASPKSSEQCLPDFARFAIGFDQRDRVRLHELIDEVLDSNRWSEAEMVSRFEAAWEAYNALPAVAMSSWSGGALAALHFAGVAGETVLCPSNTFSWSTSIGRTCACRSPIFRRRRTGIGHGPHSSSTSVVTSPLTPSRSPITAPPMGSS